MNPGILGHHRQIFNQGLGHEYPIERIGVVGRQITHGQSMIDSHIEHFEPRSLNLLFEIARGPELSQAAFDRNLPSAG